MAIQQVNDETGDEDDLVFPVESPNFHNQNQQQYRYGCTCRAPPQVSYYTTSKRNSNDVTSSHNDDSNKAIKILLMENLQTYGWSPIVVFSAPSPPPSKDRILSIFRRRRQRQRHHSQYNMMNNDDDEDLVFISAESGSNEGTVEPKESLEIELSKCYDTNDRYDRCSEDTNTNNDDDDDDDNISRVRQRQQPQQQDDECTIKTWCKTLSWIANQIICKELLEVLENTFLSENPNESLDLLRVFHYHQNNHDTKQTTPLLGSSEHTDWGSLTIVWQDKVGGLQTYCRACHKWINIRAAATMARDREDDCGENEDGCTTGEENKGTNTNKWECIVHVGDMTSLMLGHYSLSKYDNSKVNNNNNSKNDFAPPPSWPSPLHRVVSPENEERVSLVYFGYPPRGLSLTQIQKLLKSWKPLSRGRRLPLEDYYLLRNQSAILVDDSVTNEKDDGNCNTKGKNHHQSSPNLLRLSAEETYQTIRNLPVQEIVQFKWEQVNRATD